MEAARASKRMPVLTAQMLQAVRGTRPRWFTIFDRGPFASFLDRPRRAHVRSARNTFMCQSAYRDRCFVVVTWEDGLCVLPSVCSINPAPPREAGSESAVRSQSVVIFPKTPGAVTQRVVPEKLEP